jgi:hypothetical protein
MVHEFPKNGGVKTKEKYTISQLYHIIKAIIKLAVFDKDGKYYRDLLLWTYKNKRKHLSLAVMYGMMLYQLRENYNQIVNTLSKSAFNYTPFAVESGQNERFVEADQLSI